MNLNNDMIRQGLNQALAALYELDDRGCVVHSVELTSRNPVLWIDGNGAEVLGGARRQNSSTVFGTRDVVMVARVGEAQVQWRTREAVMPEPVTGLCEPKLEARSFAERLEANRCFGVLAFRREHS